METLLDLLQMYREKAGDKIADKGGSIFTNACFLLVILVQDEERALVHDTMTTVMLFIYFSFQSWNINPSVFLFHFI